MAERGTNFYYPPDFDPKKHGSANGYQGVHHLRERARKIDQGIIIVRFEMPYNIWCNGCNNHIGMGVRYNAEKSRTGKYYSTIIYKFRMKCHLCDNYFEIQTDPANLDYVILSGARRQERRWDLESNEQIAPEDNEKAKKLATDPMFKLEHSVNDQAKLQKAIPILEQIRTTNDRMKDDYACNQLLRSKFRVKRKEIAEEKINDSKLLARSSLSIPLLKESEKDKKLAKLLSMQVGTNRDDISKRKREALINQSVFDTPRSTEVRARSPNNPNDLLKRLKSQIIEKKIESSSSSGVNKLIAPSVVAKKRR